MFYAVMGALLSRAARAVGSGRLAGGDEFDERQRRRVVALLRRLGEAWPRQFHALEQENAVLAVAAAHAHGELDRRGRGDAPQVESGEESGRGEPSDPLATHLRLLAELDQLVAALHAAEPTDWARTARRQLRRELGAAAEIETQLLNGPATG
jgi:hypothetical protein